MGEHIQVKIVKFDEKLKECIALMNGLEVRVDPFTTDICMWDDREKIIGEWEFTGHWHDNCFLPYQGKMKYSSEDE